MRTRRFWQIRLSTAVLLMLTTSILMMVNFHFETSEPTLYDSKHEIASRVDNWMILPAFYSAPDTNYYLNAKAYGWPLPIAYTRDQRHRDVYSYVPLGYVEPPVKYLKGSMFLNITVWLIILFTIRTVSEYAILCRQRSFKYSA